MSDAIRPAWGKTGNDGFHLLEHHCADVAACFEALLKDPVLRTRFDRAVGEMGLDPVTETRLAVLAFFHDFGKLNTGFQFQGAETRPGAPKKVGHIKAALWACGRAEFVSALGLSQMANSWGAPGFAELFLAALAHHGRPARLATGSGLGPPDGWQPFDDYDPLHVAGTLRQRSREWFPRAFREGPELPASPMLAHLFAGVMVVADQIGSNTRLFRFEAKSDSRYIDKARRRARDAVRKTGFARREWADCTPPHDFASLFGHRSPRPLQSAVADAPRDCPLLILESETGSGKTEAAVMRFANLWQAGIVDGLYFALPTRAAAAQLHRRVHGALKNLFPADAGLGTLLAVPGYLRVGEARGWRIGKFDVEWDDDPGDARQLARWSAESARKFLSATAAVGTVDQVLLSGLQVKWAHFRGASLARSLLVVDEVHASDAYMSEILRGVLRDHLAVGGHALLMSATLGSVAREALLRPADRRRPTGDLEAALAVPYPALTLGGKLGVTSEFPGTGYTKTVAMDAQPILGKPASIAAKALAEAERGAKVLVIRNTVQQAQGVYRELLERGGESFCLRVEGGPALHHSRFAAEDRKLLDQAVESELGQGRGNGGLVVIGTQTLEQSLDIDADILFSDLCPVDVLLQRLGRVHRHEGTERPDALAEPRCVVLVPEEGLSAGLGGGLLRYGLGISRNGGIYRDLRVLELTQRLLSNPSDWVIPKMNRRLVEGGTHPDRLDALEKELGSEWRDQSLEADGRAAAERALARGHMLDRTESFGETQFPGSEEAVRTRLGEDGPRIKLDEPVVGPFGREVRTFNLPAHLFRGRHGSPTPDEIEEAHAESAEDGLILRVGSWTLRYDRAGVRVEA